MERIAMNRCKTIIRSIFVIGMIYVSSVFTLAANADVGVGAKPVAGAELIMDGSRKMLDDKWTYWKGP